MESSYAEGIEPNIVAVKPYKRGLISSSHTRVHGNPKQYSLERFAVSRPRVGYRKHL